MAQSLSKMLAHLIFSTKNRAPLIKDEIRDELHRYIAAILKELDSPAILINSVDDHIHILFSLSKNFSISKIVEEIKKGSSKWIKGKGESYAVFYWQGGYAHFQSANPMRLMCKNTLRASGNIIGAKLSRRNIGNF